MYSKTIEFVRFLSMMYCISCLFHFGESAVINVTTTESLNQRKITTVPYDTKPEQSKSITQENESFTTSQSVELTKSSNNSHPITTSGNIVETNKPIIETPPGENTNSQATSAPVQILVTTTQKSSVIPTEMETKQQSEIQLSSEQSSTKIPTRETTGAQTTKREETVTEANIPESSKAFNLSDKKDSQSTTTPETPQQMETSGIENNPFGFPIESKSELSINTTIEPELEPTITEAVQETTTTEAVQETTTKQSTPKETQKMKSSPTPVPSSEKNENLTAWQKFIKMLSENYILIVISISGVIIILIVTIATVLCVKKSRKENYNSSQNGGQKVLDDTSRPVDNSEAVLNMSTLYSRSGADNKKGQELPYIDEKGD